MIITTSDVKGVGCSLYHIDCVAKETIQLYITGILFADEVAEGLRYNKVNNQISFHTEQSLASLDLVRVVYE